MRYISLSSSFSILIIALTFAYVGRSEDPIQIDAHNRESVRSAYLKHQRAPVPPIAWTGDVSACLPGTTSLAFQMRTIQQINFYRALVGLPSVRLNTAANAKYQAAALVMFANEKLSHTPPETWRCYTPLAAAGARANIAIEAGTMEEEGAGATGPGAVDTYMVDNGISNTAAGHRRWILYPGQISIATGDVRGIRPNGFYSGTNALGVLEDTKRGVGDPQKFIAWPSPGFFPSSLLPKGRWSFALPAGDFANATVRMRAVETGEAFPVTLHPVEPLFGDPALVWEAPAVTAALGELTIEVEVSDVLVADIARDFTYRVQLFRP